MATISRHTSAHRGSLSCLGATLLAVGVGTDLVLPDVTPGDADARAQRPRFLDDDLRHSHSDLLFSAPLAADPESSACVHLLFEHQSTRDPFIALRLLRYMVLIWEEWIRLFGNSKPLPVIFPVVLAQDRRIWKLSTQFSALFGNAASLDFLRPFLPDFAFRLIHRAATVSDSLESFAASL